MGWWHPRRPPVDSGVLETDDLNEVMLRAVDESQSNLDEHNFKQGSFPDNTHFENDSFCRLYQAKNVVALVEGGPPPNVDPPPAGTIEVTGGAQWKGTGVDRTFTSVDGTLWVMASFQYSVKVLDNVLGLPPNFTVGVLFSLRVDGVLVEEVATGKAFDLNQRFHREVAGSNGAGVARYAGACSVEAFFPVGAGEHTVELVASIQPGENPDVWPTSAPVRVYSYELDVVELVRAYGNN